MGLRIGARNRVVTKLILAVTLNVVKGLKSKILRFAQNDKRLFRYNSNDEKIRL